MQKPISFINLFATTCAIFLCAHGSKAEDIKLDVTVNRNQIYIGESFDLTAKVAGSNDRTQPDLSSLKNCSIQFLGSQDSSRSSIMIINGRMTRDSFTGREFVYRITPETTGTFIAGPISLTSGNKTISANGPSIQVSGIEKQDWVYITVAPSRDSTLVDEPFEITLSVAIKKLKGPFANYDPMDPRAPPSLKVPYIEKPTISGLDTPDIKNILKSILLSDNNTAGFSINDITLQQSPWSFFDSFDSRQTAKFRLERRDTTKNNIPYYEYMLKLSYTPREEGSHTFGPIIFKGNVITDVNQGGHGTAKPVFAVGPACTVRVTPPPEEGRPDSYIGAIGTALTADASLDVQTCNVNDPLTLTITISGDISLANVFPPALAKQKALTELFKVYEDNIQAVSEQGIKKYIYTIRPQKDGTMELPPIELSYYDTNERKYKTVKTTAIPVRANKVAEFTEDLIIDTTSNKPSEGNTITSQSSLITAPMIVNLSGSIHQPIALKTWQIFAVISGPLLYALTILLKVFFRRARQKSTSRQRHKNTRKALDMVILAGKIQQTDKHSACRMLYDGWKKHLAVIFNRQEEGLTPADIKHLLDQSQIDVSMSNKIYEIVERNFNSAYNRASAPTHSVEDDCKETLNLLKSLGDE